MQGFKVLHGSRAEKLRRLTYRRNHVVGERITARSSTVRLEFEAAQAIDRSEHARVRAAGRAARGGSGRAWAAQEFACLAQQSVRRRTAAAAAETAALDTAIHNARHRRR